MATSVLVSEVLEEARVRLDLPAFSTTTFVTSAAALNFVKFGARRLSAILRRAYGSEYFTTRTTLSTQANVDTVSLPSNFTDLRQLAWMRTSTESVPLEMASVDEWLASSEDVQPWNSAPKYRLIGQTITLYPCPNAIYTLSLYYDTGIFVTATSDTISAQPGWEEWLVLDFCIRVRQKEEKDASDFIVERESVEQEILAAAQARDRFQTHTVRDLWDGGDMTDSRSLYVRR
jgi:hypothetical protein